ncbi:VWD domain-containing protein, partial [uncultured Roseovarius sp.]|uniref:VWD domain-containing protein n=1 Tax=uncultured Roseovarius sp. TaxID=293344 RepID=UPI002632B06E
MFPDAFDITSIEDFTAINGLLASTAGFLGEQEITSAFLVDPEGITVGEYLGILDTAEQNLLATDFSFLQSVIPDVRTQLEASITADTLPDGVTVDEAIDQSISVLQSIADGDTSFVTQGFDTIRSLLDGVPEETLLFDAFQMDGPDIQFPDIIEDFIGGLPAFSFDIPPAWVSGDPHLRTLDGANYDFQAAGEFVLLRSTDDQGFELQSRMVPVGENVSVNQAIATSVDGSPVMIDSADAQPLHVDGNAVALDDGDALDVGNGRIFRQGDSYTIVYPGADGEVGDGDSQVVVRVRDGRLDIDVRLNSELRGALEGLLGDGDGNPDNDIARADGTVLAQPLVFEELYGGFRDDWRVTNFGDSLFSYDSGESPDGFYQADFPGEIVSLDTLDPDVLASARQAALDAGLQEDSESFENAVLDFALTNDSGFIASALDVPVTDLGTEQADLLTGNSGDDVLDGLGGDDGIFGLAGNDVLSGGDGDDNMGGAEGNDQVNGDAGNDSMGGGPGDDTMNGGEGDDFMGGGLDNDLMDGGAGNDVVNGGPGDDTLDGGTGADTMGASFGSDVVNGGDGND